MSSEDVLKLDKPTPETERISALMKELMGRCTALVIKVATCDCPNRDNCGVFIESRKIAKVIDKLQEVKPEGVKIAKAGGKV